MKKLISELIYYYHAQIPYLNSFHWHLRQRYLQMKLILLANLCSYSPPLEE